MKKRKIPCFCDNEIEVEFPETVDLQANPEKVQEILDGSFMSFRCDSCGKILKPEFEVRIVDKSKGLEIYLLPEMERGSFARGKAKYTITDTTNGRIVIGYPELVEKIKLSRDGLDDRVLEVLKFYLLEKMEAADTVRAYYFAGTDDSIEFHIYGAREDQVGVSKVPLRIYEKIAAEIEKKSSEDPFSSILEPPYVSVQKTFREASE
ncbi:MAG TPA: CpXC domain-containing protein [Spirochaetia bacterium]|nr:CpXC domain-containing protein [Spirochaetia bacterium]